MRCLLAVVALVVGVSWATPAGADPVSLECPDGYPEESTCVVVGSTVVGAREKDPNDPGDDCEVAVQVGGVWTCYVDVGWPPV